MLSLFLIVFLFWLLDKEMVKRGKILPSKTTRESLISGHPVMALKETPLLKLHPLLIPKRLFAFTTTTRAIGNEVALNTYRTSKMAR